MSDEFNTGFTISSYCHDSSCVAVTAQDDGSIAVLDSKDLTQVPLVYTSGEWRAFVLGVKAGEFDFDLFSEVGIGVGV